MRNAWTYQTIFGHCIIVIILHNTIMWQCTLSMGGHVVLSLEHLVENSFKVLEMSSVLPLP